jgi:signal peptidase I
MYSQKLGLGGFQMLEAHFEGEVHPPPTVEIEAERQVCTIRHLSLWRDIYYIGRGWRDTVPRTPFWGSPELPIQLGEDEYYVLGDNAAISGDSRFWRHDVRLPHEDLFVESGRVPKRFMLGKAFFVYWPAGFRPFDDLLPGLVPNFGQMRFIH